MILSSHVAMSLSFNKSLLNSSWSFLKHLCGLEYFLGIRIHKNSIGTLIISRSKYIKDLVTSNNDLECNIIALLKQTTCKVNKTRSNLLPEPFMYKSIVEALQYVTLTR